MNVQMSAAVSAESMLPKQSLVISFGLHALILLVIFTLGWLDARKNKEIEYAPLDIVLEMPAERMKRVTVGGEQPVSRLSSLRTKLMAGQASRPSLLSDNSDHDHLVTQVDEWAKKNQRMAPFASQLHGTDLSQLNRSFQGSGFVWGTIGTSKAGIDLSEIASVIAKQQSSFRDCYEKALFLEPSLQGQAELLLNLNEGSKVSNLEVQMGKSLRSKGAQAFQGCIRSVMKPVVFPKNAAGRVIKFGLLLKS